MSSKPNVFGLGIATGLFWYAYTLSSPLFLRGELQLLPAMFAILFLCAGVKSLQRLLGTVAAFLEWLSAYTPTGKSGTSRWAKAKDLKPELNRKKVGPFWGLMAKARNVPLFLDFVSVAMCVAPAGSGKGIFTVIPNLFSILESKIIPSFKGEEAAVMIEVFRARGEKVIVLNPGELWKDQLNQADSYNPIDMIVDDLYREGGLRDVPGDLEEITKQIYPDPQGGETDNGYFHTGSRELLSIAIVMLAMVDEYDATLSDVALMIKGRSRLEHYLRWVTGVDLEGKPLPEGPMPIEQSPWAQKHDLQDVSEFAALTRANADSTLKMMTNPDNRTFESFISGASQKISAFAFGPLSSAMRRSTFSMNALKEGEQATSLIIIVDSSRMEVFGKFLGLIQWCAFTAIKRHKNTQRPVYAILDECTNAKVNGLDSLLTWARGYGLRCFLIFQNYHAFIQTYSEHALETLLSEAEIKLYLPGQRSQKTIDHMLFLMGEQSVMTASVSQDKEQGAKENTSESGRALMTADEVRQSRYGVLIVRELPSILVEPVSYAEIAPYRDQAGINPMHGKPFKKRVKLRL